MGGVSSVRIRVEMDRGSLSLVGWELERLQGELVVEDAHLPEPRLICRVLLRGKIRRRPPRRRPFGFGYRFGGFRYVPPIVWQLRSRTRGALGGQLEIEGMWESPSWIRQLSPRLVSAAHQDPDDLYVWVSAADWADIDEGSACSVDWAEVPIGLVVQTTHSAIGTVARELAARVRDNESLEVTMSLVHPLGGVAELIAMAVHSQRYSEDPDAPIEDWDRFLVHAPDITIDIVDKAGYVLDTRTLDNDRWIQLEAGAPDPTHYPRRVE